MNSLIHGAHWWKFDFHNHTPASTDYGNGNKGYQQLSPKQWLLLYMAQGIDCVAITDHNSGEWIDRLKVALEELAIEKPEGYRPIVIFPGVEITTSGNIHILAIFDPTSNTSKIQSLLGAVGFPSEHFGTSDAVTQKTTEVVISEIHTAGGIAIPAHVDATSGLFSTLTGHTLKQTISVDGLLAIEVMEPTADKPDIYLQSKLQLSEIIGSDSHTPTQVGSKFTWVKMGYPSIDALKLALHDGEDGVIRYELQKDDPNNIAARYFVKKISIVNGFKAGNGSPMTAELSPWFTSIIGGRGSGKSSVLNYLRIAMDRINDMPEEVQEEFNKFNYIGTKDRTGMLRATTQITVEIVKDSRVHKVCWNNNTHSLQEWDSTTAGWSTPTVVTNIKELFPIQIFSQKELYALTGNPQKLLELIDSQLDKSKWLANRNSLIEQWLADRATARQLSNAIAEEQNTTAQLKQITNRIDLVESSEFKGTLEKFNNLSEVNKYFSEISIQVTSFIQALKNVEISVPEIRFPTSISANITGDSQQYITSLSIALDSAKKKLLEAKQALQPYDKDLILETQTLNWFQEFLQAKTNYEAIENRIYEPGAETYEDLLTRRADLNAKLLKITKQKEQYTELLSQLSTLYEQIIENEKLLRFKRREVIDRWKAIDDQKHPFLTIELLCMADQDDAESTFRRLLRKTNGEFGNDIYGFDEEKKTSWGLIATIINEPEATRWEKRNLIIQDFLSASEQDKKTLDLRLAKHLDYLKSSTPEDIDRMLIWVPEDKIVLKFRKNNKEEDIQSGSAGERTAGMLGLLLAINDNPLIIDQPEDDLDSKLISSFVVDGFKKLKKTRQLVVVTHNPNITVNANSDNVVHMDFISGQIVVSANNALQDKQIRTAVCEVMEGGRDALDKRYYRISRALTGK